MGLTQQGQRDRQEMTFSFDIFSLIIRMLKWIQRTQNTQPGPRSDLCLSNSALTGVFSWCVLNVGSEVQVCATLRSQISSFGPWRCGGVGVCVCVGGSFLLTFTSLSTAQSPAHSYAVVPSAAHNHHYVRQNILWSNYRQTVQFLYTFHNQVTMMCQLNVYW